MTAETHQFTKEDVWRERKEQKKTYKTEKKINKMIIVFTYQ